jgi:hypothetical protein
MFVLHRGLGLAAVAGAGIVSALIMNAVARGLFDRRYYDDLSGLNSAPFGSPV